MHIYIYQVSCEYLMLLLNLKNCMHVKAEMWMSGNSGCNWSPWELCIFGFVKREKIKLWLEILSFINLNEQNVKIITGKLSGILSRHPYLLLFFEHDLFTCAHKYIKASIYLYYHYYIKWTCWILNHVIPILLHV